MSGQSQLHRKKEEGTGKKEKVLALKVHFDAELFEFKIVISGCQPDVFFYVVIHKVVVIQKCGFSSTFQQTAFSS